MAQTEFKRLRAGLFADLADADFQATQTIPAEAFKDLKPGTVTILFLAYDNANTLQAATVDIQPVMSYRTGGGKVLVEGRSATAAVKIGQPVPVEDVDCTGFWCRLTNPTVGSATKYEIWVRS